MQPPNYDPDQTIYSRHWFALIKLFPYFFAHIQIDLWFMN